MTYSHTLSIAGGGNACRLADLMNRPPAGMMNTPDLAPPPAPEAKRVLSERETAVLRRLSLGESNKQAARELQISPSTVRTHVESIFRKLGCSSRTAATLKGLNLGLL